MPAGAVPQIEDLWKKQSTEIDRQKRIALLGQIQQIVYDNYYMVPAFRFLALLGVNKNRIVDPSNIARVPGGQVGPFEDIQLKQ